MSECTLDVEPTYEEGVLRLPMHLSSKAYNLNKRELSNQHI